MSHSESSALRSHGSENLKSSTRFLYQGQFKEDNFNTAMSVLQNAGDAAKGDQKGRRGGNQGGGDTNIFKIVKMIMERQFAPVIIFSFSKKECEIYAMQMAKLDFNTGLCILFFLHFHIHLHSMVLN